RVVGTTSHPTGGSSMGHPTTGLPLDSESTRRDVLLAVILASAASLGLCSAFGFGFWVRGLIDRDAGRSARAAQPPVAEASQPAVAVNPAGGPAHLAAAESARPGREVSLRDPPVEAPLPAVVSNVPPRAGPVGMSSADRALAGFVLREPAPRASIPF